MPLYVYRCTECGFEADGYRKIEDRHNAPRCMTPSCYNRLMDLRIMPAMVAPDLPEYESPVTGRPVRGRRARKEDLLRSGCRPYEGREQEMKEAARWQAEQKARADETLEVQAHDVFNNLPAAAQRALEGQS